MSAISICYDKPDVPWRFQKQWTAYGRWLKKRLWYWETKPGQYIEHVLLRVEKTKSMTCNEKMAIVEKLAFKYSLNPLASINSYKYCYCLCKSARCKKRVYRSDEEKKKVRESSHAATNLARKTGVAHSILPAFRGVYPICRICNLKAVAYSYESCRNRACRILNRMSDHGGLLDKKKRNLIHVLMDNGQYEYIEICYLTAVFERFLARKRPKGLDQFFKRYKGFENAEQN